VTGQKDRGLAIRAASSGWRSLRLVAQGGQQPFEVLTARPAGAQVRCDAGVLLLRGSSRGHQLGVMWSIAIA